MNQDVGTQLGQALNKYRKISQLKAHHADKAPINLNDGAFSF